MSVSFVAIISQATVERDPISFDLGPGFGKVAASPMSQRRLKITLEIDEQDATTGLWAALSNPKRRRFHMTDEEPVGLPVTSVEPPALPDERLLKKATW